MSNPPRHTPPEASPATPEQNSTQWFTSEVDVHDSSLKAYLRGQFPSIHDVDDPRIPAP